MSSLISSAAHDYHEIERGSSSSEPDPESEDRGSKLRPSLIALACATVAFVSFALFHSQRPTLDVETSPGGQPVELGSGLLTCNCPPTEVIWQCSKEEYQALVNGSTCEFYRHKCETSCSKSEVGMECRACSSGLLVQDFCGQCLRQGLNDVGCAECQEGQISAVVQAPLELGAGLLTCNCPPAEVIWQCSKNEYQALVNGSTCEFYKHKCQTSCSKSEVGMECRACSSGMLVPDFCGQCLTRGLNDVGCVECQENVALPVVGGDADQHGCRASAGYRWCEALSNCLRPWELGLRSEAAFKGRCEPATELVGGDADEHGCRASAGYRWCSAKKDCIRPWELGLNSEDAVLAACGEASELPKPALVGGDADEHGCHASAGYRWCSAKKDCIRPWEQGLNSEDAVLAACGEASELPKPALVGGDADAHGCRPSAGYRWCSTKNACIRPWEEGLLTQEAILAACEAASTPQPVIVGGDRDKHGCIPSAGYTWCASMSKCVRPWETACPP